MSIITESQVRSSYKLLESSRQISYDSARDRKFWESVAREIIRDHITGKKKTSIAEAGILYAAKSRSKLLKESPYLINEEGWLKSAISAVGRAAKSAMMGLGKGVAKAAKVGGNVTGLSFVRSKNWWLFGGGGEEKDQQYRDAYLDALNKRNEIVDKVLEKSVGEIEEELTKKFGNASAGESAKSGKAGPQNVPDPETFKKIISDWCGAYALICAAAGVEVEGFEGLDVKEGAERISVEAANDSISSIRKIFETYDRFLFDGYAYSMDLRGSSDIWGNTSAGGFKEGRRRNLSLVEALGLNEETGESQDSKIGKQGRQTSTMDMLKSNIAPAVIGALGAATAAAGILIQTSWFLKLITIIEEVDEWHKIREVVPEYVDQTIGQVTKANGWEGLNIYMQNVWDANLDSGSTLAEARAAFAKVGGGDWKAGVRAMTDNGNGVLGRGYPEADDRIIEFLSGNTGATKWADAYSQLGTGTHKLPNDMLQLDVGTIKKKMVNYIIKTSWTKSKKLVTKTIISGGTISVAGPILTVLGVSAIAAAISLKALRMWGAENSRASYINAMLQKLKDIPPRKEEEEQIELPPKPTLPPPRPPGSRTIAVKLDNKGTYFVYPVDNVAEGENPEDWKIDDDVFTMPGYERPGKVPTAAKNDKGEDEEIRGDENLKKFCIALLLGDKKSGADIGIKDMSAINEFKWTFVDNRSDSEASEVSPGADEKEPVKPGGKNRKISPGQGSLVRVDLTTREPGGGSGPGVEQESVSRKAFSDSKSLSLKDFLFEAGEASRVGSKTSNKARKSWKSLSDDARNSTTGVPEDKTKFPTQGDKFFSTHGIDKNSELNQKTYSDNVIKRGLDGIRRFARSGNIALGFDDQAIAELNKVGITEPMLRVLLKIYTANPSKAPESILTYIDALEKAGVKEKNLKKISQGGLERVLIDIGMLNDGPRRKKKTAESHELKKIGILLKEIASDDITEVNNLKEDEIILERWQTLAGLVD